MDNIDKPFRMRTICFPRVVFFCGQDIAHRHCRSAAFRLDDGLTFPSFIRTLYEDRTRFGYLNWHDVCHADPETRVWLAADVQDRQLREHIIALCSETFVTGQFDCGRKAGFPRSLRSAWEMPLQ